MKKQHVTGIGAVLGLTPLALVAGQDRRFSRRDKGAGKVRVAIIGAAGGQALHFLRLAMGDDDSVLVAVVDSNTREAELRSREYGGDLRWSVGGAVGRLIRGKGRTSFRDNGCRVFASVDALVAAVRRGELQVDLGIVCTPPLAHAHNIVALLDIDAVVLYEKPPTLTLDEMREIRAALRRAAARGSRAWIMCDFQLEEQWSALREKFAEYGLPFELQAIWRRGFLAPVEAREEAGATRRGQADRPMQDLCHMLHAVLCLIPGLRLLRVKGETWEDAEDRPADQVAVYETLTATAMVPWRGVLRRVELRVKVGWNIPLLGENTREEVSLTIQGSRGKGVVNLLVDDTIRAGRPRAPRFYWPQFAVINTQSGQDDVVTKSPQPRSVAECYKLLYLRVVGKILAGERVEDSSDEGMKVMLALELFMRSIQLGREVSIEEVSQPGDDEAA